MTDDQLRVKSVHYRKKLLKYILDLGLAFSVGVAIAAKKDNVRYKTYTLPGDKGVSFEARSELGKANLDVFSETLVSLAERDNHVLAVATDSRGSGRLVAFCRQAARSNCRSQCRRTELSRDSGGGRLVGKMVRNKRKKVFLFLSRV